jgi:RHS repeat-associated protein
MWVPFGLPGQILLGGITVMDASDSGTNYQWGTEAYANGAGGTWTRPPLSLNRIRTYDPLLGEFLQPDPADQRGRSSPEGYAYARNSPLSLFDPTGADSSPMMGGCTSTQQDALRGAINQAISGIETCRDGECGFPSGEAIRQDWIAALRATDWTIGCLKNDPIGQSIDREVYGYFAGASDDVFDADGTDDAAEAITLIAKNGVGRNQTVLVPDSFLPVGSPYWSGNFSQCLAQRIAHEALHRVDENTSFLALSTNLTAGRSDLLSIGPTLGRFLMDVFKNNSKGVDGDDLEIIHTVDKCVTCSK